MLLFVWSARVHYFLNAVLQFIFLVTYLMIFCGNLLYLLSVVHLHTDPAGASIPIIVMFTGVLVITVFEVSGVFTVCVLQDHMGYNI